MTKILQSKVFIKEKRKEKKKKKTKKENKNEWKSNNKHKIKWCFY